MPLETKKYKVFTQNNWHVLLKTTRLFGQIQFVEDEEQLLWLFDESTGFAEPLMQKVRAPYRHFMTELYSVERTRDNLAIIRIRRYINLFSKILVRFEGAALEVEDLSDEDYELLSSYSTPNRPFLILVPN